MNEKFKKLWVDTPANVSGCIVLVVLLGILALVIWADFNSPTKTIHFLIAASIGGVVAYRVFLTGKLVLDPQRTVTGWLAKTIGIIGAILALVSGYFAIIVIYNKFLV
jgi:hypothetical protein